jgi:hypothetical protein
LKVLSIKNTFTTIAPVWVVFRHLGRVNMKAPLSQNELEILDRQAAALVNQLTEIANLLETRLGESTELALTARSVQEEFAKLARQIHRQAAIAGSGLRVENRPQTA